MLGFCNYVETKMEEKTKENEVLRKRKRNEMVFNQNDER